MSKITTTGELREFLCSAIDAVANGTMDADKARNITKLAGQINESIYAEIKVAKTQLEMHKPAATVGDMKLGSSGGRDA